MEVTCNRCPHPSVLVSYWGEALCRACNREAYEEYDRDGTWPVPTVLQQHDECCVRGRRKCDAAQS